MRCVFYGLWCFWKIPTIAPPTGPLNSHMRCLSGAANVKQQNTIFTYDNDWRESGKKAKARAPSQYPASERRRKTRCREEKMRPLPRRFLSDRYSRMRPLPHTFIHTFFWYGGGMCAGPSLTFSLLQVAHTKGQTIDGLVFVAHSKKFERLTWSFSEIADRTQFFAATWTSSSLLKVWTLISFHQFLTMCVSVSKLSQKRLFR